MPKARSPSYPAISLKEAIEKAEAIYRNDYQNPISREIAGAHMGYKSLHGTALGVLSALAKYGLLEGRGDNNRVADWAVKIIAHPAGSTERVEGLKLAAGRPKLFAELDARFPGSNASDQNIRSYLLTKKYIPSAADAAIRAYRETKQLVDEESSGNAGNGPQEPTMPTEGAEHTVIHRSPSPSPIRPSAPGILQEVFNLDEGPVTLAYPGALSVQSYEDLKAQLELFLRRAQRRAGKKSKEK